MTDRLGHRPFGAWAEEEDQIEEQARAAEDAKREACKDQKQAEEPAKE